MANTYKVLGQVNPAATTATTLYTCATTNGAVVSTLSICNQGLPTSIRIAVRPAGATLTSSQYILYDVPVSNNDSLFLTIGVSLANTDVITCYAGTENVSFGLFGTELS